MKLIPLSQGLFAMVDDEDFERVNVYKWSAHTAKDKTPYAVKLKKIKRMHRFILNITDRWQLVDHRDGNGLNNCKSNLRVCGPAQNLMNRRKIRPTASKYKGVYFRRGRWYSTIQFQRKHIYLGSFTNEDAAALAYNTAAVKYFGEFAKINEVPGSAVIKDGKYILSV